MRQLRFVKPGDDPDHVVLETADGGEQFLLRVDTVMRDAVRSDLPRLTPATTEPAPIGPREIQVRVRSGETPEALAEQNAMSLEKVMRFAGPVIAERSRIADEARRARARRSTTEGQSVVFGEAVDERFGAHGIDVAAVRWDARRREDGQWIIGARWLGGDADRLAEWIFHLGTRTVTPVDDTAADLLSDRPIRAIVADEQQSLSAAPPLAPGVVAFPAMPDAHTGKQPNLDEVFDQDAVDHDKPRVARPAAPVRPAAKAPLPPAEYDAPPLPLRLAEPADDTELPTVEVAAINSDPAPVPRRANLGIAHRTEESEDQRAERSRIPSWDDIMLGVRRKSD
ncbi:MAG: septation protein SepH [Jatrophihabitantaceae bacterium]